MHNDERTEVIIEADIDGVQVERYYIGFLSAVPAVLRSQVVISHGFYADADMPVLTIARNSAFCKFMDYEYDDEGTDLQLGKYDVEVANGRGYYDCDGSYVSYGSYFIAD